MFKESEKEVMLKTLHFIESFKDVKIIHAAEFGPNATLDRTVPIEEYDTRFIYVAPNSSDLFYNDKTFTINIDDIYKIQGINVRQIFYMLHTRDPQLYEILASRSVYHRHDFAMNAIETISFNHFSQTSLMAHYIEKALESNSKYSRIDENELAIGIEHFISAIHSVLRCLWIEIHNSNPPIEFEILVCNIPVENIKAAICELLSRNTMNLPIIRSDAKLIFEYVNDSILHFNQIVGKLKNPPAPSKGMLEELYLNLLDQMLKPNFDDSDDKIINAAQ
jgi:predicted nucleotidyltransferase